MPTIPNAAEARAALSRKRDHDAREADKGARELLFKALDNKQESVTLPYPLPTDLRIELTAKGYKIGSPRQTGPNEGYEVEVKW